MPPVVYEIDPDYDTVIVLSRPCGNFAPWDPTAEISEHIVSELQLEPEAELVVEVDHDENDSGTSGKAKKKGKKGKKVPFEADDNGGISAEKDDGGTVAVAEGSTSGGGAQPTDAGLSYNANPVPGSEVVDKAESQIESVDLEDVVVHYRVSSRHLTLVSPWFKRTLTSSSSSEAVRNPTDGYFYVAASDWDEKAFLILLNIFHLRKRQIPKTMSIEMLAKIAVLVDYYELEKAEAIEDYVETWVNHVRRNYPVPTSYGRDLVLWMCVSAVLGLATEFEKATAVAIRESMGSIQTLSLPIPLGATRDIDQKRVDAIDRIISELHCLLDKYRSTDHSCPYGPSFYCGAFLFGALHKEMERWGFLAPRPERPFLGSSLKGVCSKIDTVRSPKWYHRNNYSLVEHPCSLKREVDSILQNSTESIGGLKLSDLKGG